MYRYKLFFKSTNYSILDTYVNYILTILNCYKKVNFKIVAMPTKIQRLTVLRSPHVHKKAKDQYETRIYQLVLYFYGENFILNIIKFLLKTKPHEISCKIVLNNNNKHF